MVMNWIESFQSINRILSFPKLKQFAQNVFMIMKHKEYKLFRVPKQPISQ